MELAQAVPHLAGESEGIRVSGELHRPELRDDKTPQFEPEPESTARLEKPDGDP
jgi:hypothetical protein